MNNEEEITVEELLALDKLTLAHLVISQHAEINNLKEMSE